MKAEIKTMTGNELIAELEIEHYNCPVMVSAYVRKGDAGDYYQPPCDAEVEIFKASLVYAGVPGLYSLSCKFDVENIPVGAGDAILDALRVYAAGTAADAADYAYECWRDEA